MPSITSYISSVSPSDKLKSLELLEDESQQNALVFSTQYIVGEKLPAEHASNIDMFHHKVKKLVDDIAQDDPYSPSHSLGSDDDQSTFSSTLNLPFLSDGSFYFPGNFPLQGSSDEDDGSIHSSQGSIF